jgi:hypothetical protein
LEHPKKVGEKAGFWRDHLLSTDGRGSPDNLQLAFHRRTNGLADDFREFLKLLNRRKVKYMLISGYAVNYYEGEPVL